MPLRLLMALAILLNTLDLIATSFGILSFGNAEGNPLLAALMERSWLVFMLVKGVGVPLLLAFLVTDWARRGWTPEATDIEMARAFIHRNLD